MKDSCNVEPTLQVYYLIYYDAMWKPDKTECS